MHRHGQSYDYRKYTFILPPKSPPRSSNQGYEVRRVHGPKSTHSNTTSIPAYSTARLTYQYSSPPASDLHEQIPIRENRQSAKRYRSPVNHAPLTYTSSTPNQHTTTNDERLTNATTMRERLLQDIQRNINEIDEELSTLKNRYPMPSYVPTHLSPMSDARQTSNPQAILSSNDENKVWPNKQRKSYQVIPRIPSESKTASKKSRSNETKKKVGSRPFRGQYHYGAEIEESVIRDNDPENSDRRSTVEEISRLRFYESLSLDPFRREQSDLSQHRALISVPEYGDNQDIIPNESAEEIDQNSPVDMNVARSSTVQSIRDLSSATKLNIQDFQSLIHTAPESKVEPPAENDSDCQESSIQIPLNSNSSILSKPVIHSRQSVRTQETRSFTPQLVNIRGGNGVYDVNDFLSNFKNDYDDGDAEFISIDPFNMITITESKLASDYTRGDTFVKPIQASTLNNHSSQQQHRPLLIENNTHHSKETEKKKLEPTTKHFSTTFVTKSSPPMKVLPNSIYNDNKTHTPKKKNNSNEQQRKTSKFVSNVNNRPRTKLNN